MGLSLPPAQLRRGWGRDGAVPAPHTEPRSHSGWKRPPGPPPCHLKPHSVASSSIQVLESLCRKPECPAGYQGIPRPLHFLKIHELFAAEHPPPCAARCQPGRGRTGRDTWDLAGSGQCPCSHRQLLHSLQLPGVAAVIYVAAARRARAPLGMLHGLHHLGFWVVPCPLSLLSGIRGQERKLFSQLITTTTL